MCRISRRNFLSQLVLGKEHLSDGPQKTLVCIFLRGGADTLSLVVPYADDAYYRVRPTIAISAPGKNVKGGASIRLDDFYAFHPRLKPLEPIFKEGRLGIVQAVGTDNPTGSHFETQDQMEHGEAYGNTTGGGWLGRHLRTSSGSTQTPLSAVAVGATMPESLRGAPTASVLQSVDQVQLKTPTGDPQAAAAALSSMYGAEVGVLSKPGMLTLDLLKRVENLRGKNYKPAGNAQYPTDNLFNSFGSGLREIARLIKANVGLEVACLDLDGWDTHFFQGAGDGNQAETIDTLARGLAAFDADLKNYRDRATVLVMTEFGRRTYENGSLGTDHGRGFAMMAIGNEIAGGQIHGKWPGVQHEAATADLLGPAGLAINYDYRSVLAEVLSGIMGNLHTDEVFPDFKPQAIGLVKPRK